MSANSYALWPNNSSTRLAEDQTSGLISIDIIASQHVFRPKHSGHIPQRGVMRLLHSLIESSNLVLKVRIPVPVTPHMLVVLLFGGILAAGLGKLPKFFKALSGIVALVTIVAVVAIGIDDVRGGDLFDRATGAPCVGWNGYVDDLDNVNVGYNRIIQGTKGSSFTSSKAAALAEEAISLSKDLTDASPPDGARALHQNWISILNETEAQLRSYQAGGDFEVSNLNSLIDSQHVLIREANQKCGGGSSQVN